MTIAVAGYLTAVRRFLVVNPGSGDARPGPDELRRAAQDRGIVVHVLAQGDDLVTIARRSAADVIGMAGGDGSLGAVALVAVERDIPFVCVPFGTRNHFARDLGLERDDPIGALEAFDMSRERRVDLGFAGDRAFLNNASIGAYAKLVERREHHRRRGNALARLRALALSARRPSRPTSSSTVPARSAHPARRQQRLLAPGRELGARNRLDEGRLHLYLAEGLLPGGWRELPARRELSSSHGRRQCRSPSTASRSR